MNMVIRTSAVLIALALLATASVGQENPPPPPAAPPPAPATPPADKPPAAAPPAAGAEVPPATGVMRGDEFIPTQELQADEEATFPVDI
jgi:hypothetical protein